MLKKSLHILLIEKLVPGGLGLGRLADGIIVLVRYVLPGEKVLVHEVRRKKDYISATLKEVLSPSPDRIRPPCPVYGRCGGCDLQHAEPGAQIRLKKTILSESLQRAGGDMFSNPLLSIDPPLAAPKQFGYRQRIRLQVDEAGNYGFFRPESHVIEPVSQCLLANNELNNVLKQLHSSDSFKSLITHCNAFELLFDPGKNNSVMLLHFQRKPRPADCLLAADLQNTTDGLSALLMQVKEYGLYNPLTQNFPPGPPILWHTSTIDVLETKLNFSWEAGGFCQVNLEQNNTLINLVVELVASGPHKRILDLYCGYGNFSLPLAQLAEKVLGIDSQNAAIRSAQRNAEYAGSLNCRFEKNQVPTAALALIAAGETFETVILDPPRQGASEVMLLLPKLSADQIIYISCNPATLARDLTILLSAGYQ
jgi:23S rRNA (uracil1939-C5)-methyltransferase